MQTWMSTAPTQDMCQPTHNSQGIFYTHGSTRLQAWCMWLTRGTLTRCDRHGMADSQTFWQDSVMKQLNRLCEAGGGEMKL